ncbi:hypothetical protein FFI94_018775 [Rhodococcus sp. KBS0724]|uniref:hypothetical protein n=1 Tax=Rhodococcus sp. KBS0724 TaxID=1179674 RepID=UPI00110EC8D0|nr:hypothetical protein [Rhodococcus sp. KBS0724]TSD47961.1 hypothetical protein FFI94_018775 [Rhodococcus sp. KBS0724]
MTEVDDSLPWPPPDKRANVIRELRRENGKLLEIVVGTLGVGSDTDPRKGQAGTNRKRHAIEILQAIGQARNDRHTAHYIRLGRQYGLTFPTIANLLDITEGDVHEILDRTGVK